MYADRDGAATKQSQAAYDARVRCLLLVTSVLASIGLSAAVVDGQYARNAWQLKPSLWGPHIHLWARLLWPLIWLNSLALFWKHDAIALHNRGVAGSAMSAPIVYSCLFTIYLGDPDAPADPTSPAPLQMYCAIFLSLAQALIPRRPQLFIVDGRPADAEASASALSRYSMNWCNEALTIAAQSGTLDALPILSYNTRAASQPLIHVPSPEPYIWNRILTERLYGFAKQWMLTLLCSITALGSPFCMMRLLRCLEAPQRADEAWMWLMGVGASSTCYAVVNHQLLWVQWSEMAVPVRAQLTTSVFHKMLRSKDSKGRKKGTSSSAAPGAVNLVMSDTNLLAKFTAVNYLFGSIILKFLSTALFLLDLLGWQSCLVAIAATVSCLSVHSFTVKQLHAARKKLKASRDRTTRVMEEALYVLREMKFSSLEAPWEAHINASRDDELKGLYRTRMVTTIHKAWETTAPFLVMTASISMYLYMGGEVTPSILFPMVTVLPQLQETLRLGPLVLLDYFTSVATASRLDTYLSSPEKEAILQPSPSGQVLFQDATIAWGSDDAVKLDAATNLRFSLYNLNLEFPAGQLSIVSGKTGSGKSLLLEAILGEVDLLAGYIKAPSIAHGSPVAYVSQTPWLQNTTIQQNILFGHPFNKQRYDSVVAACALQSDLTALADGDQTQIGLKGVKLSGGQRARLAFARALYSPAQLLVMDDIFSALDSHVSNDIFCALTGNPGHGRTRIIATHHVSLCLPSARYLVHVENNTIAYAGKPESVKEEIEQTGLDDVADLVATTEDEADDESSATPKKSSNTPRFAHSRSNLSLYRRLFSAAGGITFVFFWVAGLVMTELLDALASYLLGRVKSSRQPDPSLPPSLDTSHSLERNLQTYLGVSLVLVAANCIFSQHAHSGSLLASRVLFRQMTFRVLRMPLQWLDETPFGETLKTFTVDARSVDDDTLVIMSSCANGIIKLMTIVCIGIYSSRYTGILTIFLLFWCIKISRTFIRAKAAVRRVDGGPLADILEHITSTTASLATIRAFGATGTFIDEMHHYIDKESKLWRHFWIFNRWLGLQMAFIGIALNMGTGIFLLSSSSIVDTTYVGFLLTFSMGLIRAIFGAVNEFSQLETYMDAVAAVLGYTTLETENLGGEDVPEDWPSKGEVDVQDLQVAYASSLPLVLKSISFHVGASQRVGIVGRTGAGKSSLALSLLRLLEPQSGFVRIDNIDISTIKLAALRSRIAFIPQDPTLFSGTIRSNLDFFQKVPVSKLEDALRQVKLFSEDGNTSAGLFALDSHISAAGANISQGQRQLLCLARVLIKRPKIIILDEATSAVDSETDKLIQEVVRKQFTGTLMVVAHRLQTIASFDRTIVMDGGVVAEQGTPKGLLERRGPFYELVRDSQDRDLLEKTILRT